MDIGIYFFYVNTTCYHKILGSLLSANVYFWKATQRLWRLIKVAFTVQPVCLSHFATLAVKGMCFSSKYLKLRTVDPVLRKYFSYYWTPSKILLVILKTYISPCYKLQLWYYTHLSHVAKSSCKYCIKVTKASYTVKKGIKDPPSDYNYTVPYKLPWLLHAKKGETVTSHLWSLTHYCTSKLWFGEDQ